jgi:hypothetical protein
MRDGGCDSSALSVEFGASAEPNQHCSASVGVRHRQVLERRLCLPALEQLRERPRAKLPIEALALEHAHHDCVGVSGKRAIGRRLDVHGAAR